MENKHLNITPNGSKKPLIDAFTGYLLLCEKEKLSENSRAALLTDIICSAVELTAEELHEGTLVRAKMAALLATNESS